MNRQRLALTVLTALAGTLGITGCTEPDVDVQQLVDDAVAAHTVAVEAAGLDSGTELNVHEDTPGPFGSSGNANIDVYTIDDTPPADFDADTIIDAVGDIGFSVATRADGSVVLTNGDDVTIEVSDTSHVDGGGRSWVRTTTIDVPADAARAVVYGTR